MDEPGFWVELKDFWGNKSFGMFECEDCDQIWLSAHAFKRFKQACKSCETWSPPKFMWVNAERGERNKYHKEPDLNKPHHRDRCEACRRGVCTNQGGRGAY